MDVDLDVEVARAALNEAAVAAEAAEAADAAEAAVAVEACAEAVGSFSGRLLALGDGVCTVVLMVPSQKLTAQDTQR